jgi:hypothetical protein
MDVNAILNESLKTFSRPAASKAAQFILMLSVIDRTILPRRITFTNSRSRLTIIAADRKARLADADELGDSQTDLTSQMVDFCLKASALKHAVRSAKPGAAGVTISELVNAQRIGSGATAESSIPRETGGFKFDERGWPLTMPEDASAKSLVSAWLVHLWMQSWLKRREEMFGDTVLMVTTEGNRSRELAFHFSPRTTDIMSLGPGELGRLLAAWRIAGAAHAAKLGGQPASHHGDEARSG